MKHTLLLIPTELERQRLQPRLESLLPESSYDIELCGFGIVASGCRTSLLLGQKNWSRVILVGIAGGYADRVPIGSAIEFQRVRQWGVGVGEGTDFQVAGELGWSHWKENDPARNPIGDEIELNSHSGRELISVCSASLSLDDASIKTNRYARADAEDMEGFAVAVACEMYGIPLNIVRGISNIAGNRDHSSWRVDASLDAAAALVASIL